MTGLASRLWTGEDDLQSIKDLMEAIRPPGRLADYPAMADLHEMLALPLVQQNTRLWLDGAGRLIGFALVDQYNNLRFEVDWCRAGADLETDLVAWGVECIRRITPDGSSATLDTSCREDDHERVALLRRQGFVQQTITSLKMVRSLTKPVQPAEAPAGFVLRHVTGEQEVEALVELHRAAFGTQFMTVAERLAMMRVPGYDPELDLVAVAPDGRLAAYCFCSISLEENLRSGRKVGATDPVATHPDYQGRGLGRALLLKGLLALKSRGMETAVLGTSSENAAMQRLALSVGFRIEATTAWFSRLAP